MTYTKDLDCTKETPVMLGYKDEPIYGKGVSIKPVVEGRQDTKHDQSVYLPSLLPLEDYDRIIIFFSGGKDSVAVFYKLLEMGVPKSRIELWHHDIDGGSEDKTMDWAVTNAYVRSFAEANDVALKMSWRVNGFWGEVYREGASQQIAYEDGGKVHTVPLSKRQQRSEELKALISQAEIDDDLGLLQAAQAELKTLGYRYKFPAKSADLNSRWCSAYLKIMVGDSIIANLGYTKRDTKILVLSGERRGESTNRAKYNEMELHKTNAQAINKRLVHHWRPVMDYSERDIWEVFKRNHVNPHPCYRAGWNRCSCMMCIFSSPGHWKGIQSLFPVNFQQVRDTEIELDFTLDNKKNLDQVIEGAESCVSYKDKHAIDQLITGTFYPSDIFTKPGTWTYPAGAFRGSDGGPC